MRFIFYILTFDVLQQTASSLRHFCNESSMKEVEW